ncbi:preprotein translocase subunit SecE [Candidatus Albibeggiatoa sp. nov. BB20]|uniref:preprotein translocase subunit SecE n=1 Tax=Candidatus Albibeggiatoa sp. nov. BB20 TaxID=3162723 RepID=UPI0033654C66
MSTIAAESKTTDFLKWVVAIVLITVGMVGFYYFSDQSLLARVVGLLGLSGIAIFLASTTAKGRESLVFLREAHTEVRKVVWPTRQETIQTTAIVLGMVLLVAIFIWMLDSALFWIVSSLTGRGS